jgi:formylglycine-generating enzyme required for sulfatase activity
MGEAEDLLGKYAWYHANSPSRTHPVGSLRPNDLGLFDLHGNAWEWCHSRFEYFTDMRYRDMEDKMDDKSSRLLRGGAFTYLSWLVRSSNRVRSRPANRVNYGGFRPARTFR